jgi:hypothetical protein
LIGLVRNLRTSQFGLGPLVISLNPLLLKSESLRRDASDEIDLPDGTQAQMGAVGGLRRVGLPRSGVLAKRATPYDEEENVRKVGDEFRSS